MQSTEFLPFAKPTISPEAIAEVVECLQSGWLTTGPRTQRFEAMLRAYFNTPALTCLSATAGLFMALRGLNLKEGDEVITTPLTFVATLNTIVQAGAKPVLVDVDPNTYNIDVNRIEKAITSRTRAIMPVHFAGLPVDLDVIYALADKHQLTVIEDAAHAIGASYKGKRLGSFGHIQVFSLHPNKNMTTGEGGVVTTKDEAMARHINLYRFHGIDREAWNRFSRQGSAHYDVVAPGYKFNFMDIQAALGLHQLPALDGFIERRTALAMRYYEQLKDTPYLELPPKSPKDSVHAWHLFAPQVRTEALGLNRDELMDALKALNIGTGLHYPAAHLYTYYRQTFGYKPGDFPYAEHIGNHIISLPLFPSMTEAEQDRVIEAIHTVAKK